MISRLLSAHDGIQQIHHYDPATRLTSIETITDARDIVELNIERMKEKRPRGDGMRMVASLPMSVYHDLHKRGILRDKKALKAWLNDPDNRFFRTTTERV
jgi:hypothetical protein